MPRFSKATNSNESLRSKYAINRVTNFKTDSSTANDDIFSSRFHVSDSLESSKKWLKEQKSMLKSKRIMFEDKVFPAENSSLFYSERPKQNYEWKRPKEISTNPTFISDGATRFDVRQGEIGDCWFLAAICSLSMHENLLMQIVIGDQEFNTPDYCGLFMFRFWKFGTWVDVVVDDRLPTYRNKLVYLHGTDPNEFWSALMEKAYAKLVSSYEALKGGSSSEAMEDFTGGISEIIDLGKATPPGLWDTLVRASNLSSLMGCSIEGSPNEIEAKGNCGLIKGHAYSITEIATVTTKKGNVNLIRVRNPWGNEYEWKGPWSDNSTEWKDVSDQERKRIGMSVADDGEFWMSFSDFTTNFMKLEICHLSPESEAPTLKNKKKRKWEMCVENGEWQKNVSAGGCRNFINTFHMNPQFYVNVTDPDLEDDSNCGTLIVGLMQKEMRARRKEGQDFYTIGYVIYAIKGVSSVLLDTNFFKTNTSIAKSPAFVNTREICGRHKLPVGKYAIIPSTFNANEEAKFLLRIFSERPYDSKQMDDSTDISYPISNKDSVDGPSQEDDQTTEKLRQGFMYVAGDTKEIDPSALQGILNSAFKNENFKFVGFSRETCRSLVAMMDTDQSGMLGFDEFKILWNDLRLWKTVFKKFDLDQSGTLNSSEMRECLNNMGFKISNRIFAAVMIRYSGRDGIIEFDDFILLAARLKTVFLTFKGQKKTSTGDAVFPRDEFIQYTLYM